jgi:hypothetical protein
LPRSARQGCSGDAEKSKVEFGFVPGEEVDKVGVDRRDAADVADRYASFPQK